MMGERTVMQEVLFYNFRIEDHVPGDYLLRGIDRFFDLAGIREHLNPFYSSMGRPSIDPEMMVRMLIVGYAWASGRSGGCPRKCVSLSPIAGSVGSISMVRCPITRPSRITGTDASATATGCASCSRQPWSAAWPRGWSAPRALRQAQGIIQGRYQPESG